MAWPLSAFAEKHVVVLGLAHGRRIPILALPELFTSRVQTYPDLEYLNADHVTRRALTPNLLTRSRVVGFLGLLTSCCGPPGSLTQIALLKAELVANILTILLGPYIRNLEVVEHLVLVWHLGRN